MIEKWEFAHFPFDKDARRYKARVRGAEDDIQRLIQKLPANCGRPFVTLSQDYNWAFYLYALTEENRAKTIEIFKSYTPNGEVLESAAIAVEKELPPMLEDILDAAAKSLIPQGKSAPPSPRPAAFPSTPPPTATPPKDEPAAGAIESSALNPSYLFSEFVVGTNNRFTHAAAQAVAEKPGSIYNPLFIYGEVGLGKTHLMHAVGQCIVSKNPQTKLLCASTEKFMSQMIESIRAGTINQLRNQYRTLDLLLIDDIQFLSGSESTQEEFFHVFNTLHEREKQIVITSDRPPKQLNTLEDRLRSRFEWGLITDLKPPSLETRVAILKKKCEALKLAVDEELLIFIAERVKSNIRELEGILKKIHAATTITRETLSLELIKNLVGDSANEPSAAVPSGFVAPGSVHQAMDKTEKVERTPLPPKEPAPAGEKPVLEKMPVVPADQHISGSVSISSGSAEKKEGFPLPAMQYLRPSEPAVIPKPAPADPAFARPVTHPLRPDPAQAVQAPQVSPPASQNAGQPKTEFVSIGSVSKKKEDNPPIEPAANSAPPKEAAGGSPEPAAQPAPAEPAGEKEEVDLSLKPVEVVCFYPNGKEQEFSAVKHKFHDVIKKHKLKIRIVSLATKPYAFEGEIDYAFFVKECKACRCNMALILGLPPTAILSEDDFATALGAALEQDQISFQFVPWSELAKDYRYLNCALDLSLSIPAKSGSHPDQK